MKKLLLTAGIISTLVGSLNAQLAFTVDPGAAWNSYINVFAISVPEPDLFAFGFGDTPNLSTTAANFDGSTLTISPNTRIYDEEIVQPDPVWFDVSDPLNPVPSKYIEANVYQEVTSTVGTTVTFDFTTLTDTLAPGYTAIGFIKVLDGFATWATTQFEQVSLVAGSTESLSLSVVSPGAGTPIVQAGFALTGGIVSASDPITLTGVSVTTVPEPSTFALIGGFLALGLVMYRRRKQA